MARPQQISDDVVRKLVERGLNAPEIVKETGASRATVYRALKRLQKVRAYVRHDDAFPWDVRPEHQHAAQSQYIRSLSLAAKTGGGDMDLLNTAFRWAKALIVAGQDVDYDPDYRGTEFSPFGGYREIPAPDDGGYIKRLYDAALRGPVSERS